MRTIRWMSMGLLALGAVSLAMWVLLRAIGPILITHGFGRHLGDAPRYCVIAIVAGGLPLTLILAREQLSKGAGQTAVLLAQGLAVTVLLVSFAYFVWPTLWRHEGYLRIHRVTGLVQIGWFDEWLTWPQFELKYPQYVWIVEREKPWASEHPARRRDRPAKPSSYAPVYP